MRWLARTAAVVLIAVVVSLAGAHALLRGSLPRLDGTIEARTTDGGPALGAPVTIERDALGIPTIRGASRADVAYATGFVHAQDRFFQMDLSRRLAAGELAELFGEVAAEQDASARAFGFREVSRDVLRQESPEELATLAAYTRGVNAGLASLRSRPWEYWVLRRSPAPWREEDTILVAYSMWWDLQYAGWQREIVLRTLDARLGGPVCESGWKCATEFFYPSHSEWDAPNTVDGAPARLAMLAPVPPPDALDLRDAHTPSVSTTVRALERELTPGSNNWAVAGRLTASGAALVANDMHLNSRVPAVWYRARLVVADADSAPSLDLNGVTLPGAPTLVAGSNGRIAWGFTNSYGDWQDVVRQPCDASDAGIRVATGEEGHCWFVRWVAQSPEASNLRMLQLERATSVDEALALAPRIGIPHNNLIVGDRDGHIGWTLIGRIPRGVRDARAAARSGWLDANEQPRIVDPPVGRLWTANALPTADAAQEHVLGDDETAVGVGYDLGARASQIRDGLLAIEHGATPADMLRIQLDDRAVFIARWRTLVLDLLDNEAVARRAERAGYRKLIADWTPRASADSVGYRLVRAYHAKVERSAWAMLLAGLDIPFENARIPARFEAPLWRLVTEQPSHLLAPRYSSWREFLLAQLDATIAELTERCGALANCTWGAARPVRMRHPLSQAVPFLSRFIDMPTVELPGDADMPRVQSGSFGASERFAVSPGHEADGYLHIAGGQSGHPLSAFYRAGFREWAEGKPLPFLPGSAEHRLVLR